jgi:hypothetical protein
MGSVAAVATTVGSRGVANAAQSEQQAGGKPAADWPAGPQGQAHHTPLPKNAGAKTRSVASLNIAERNMLVQQLQEQISKATDSIRETQAILASRGSSSGAASADIQEFVHKIQQLRAQLDTVLVSPPWPGHVPSP